MPERYSRFIQLIWRVAALASAAVLLLIPVQCDASPLPHSIFVDPMVMAGFDDTFSEFPTSSSSQSHHGNHGLPTGAIGIPSHEHASVGATDPLDDGVADLTSLRSTSLSMIESPFTISLVSSFLVPLSDEQLIRPVTVIAGPLTAIAPRIIPPPPR